MTETRPLVLVWLALLALLAVTVVASFHVSGALSVAISLSVAVMSAALIFWFFMGLRDENGLIRVFALGAVGWLIILLLLAATDYVTRGGL